MPDHSDPPTAVHGAQPSPVSPDHCTPTAEPSREARQDTPVTGTPVTGTPATGTSDTGTSDTVTGHVRRLRVPLVGTATLTTVAGGALGTRAPGVLLVGVTAVLIGIVVVAVILAVGFVHEMAALGSEGRRRSRSVQDVGVLMTGAAGAYRQVLAQFTALLRGVTTPPPEDRAAAPPTPPSARR